MRRPGWRPLYPLRSANALSERWWASLWLAVFGAPLPGRPDAKLLLVLSLGDRRGELHPLEPRRSFEQRDELAGRIGLTRDLHPLAVHAQRLEPAVLRDQIGQVAHERKRLDPSVLHGPEGSQHAFLLRHVREHALDRLDLGLDAPDLLGDPVEVALLLICLSEDEGQG